MKKNVLYLVCSNWDTGWCKIEGIFKSQKEAIKRGEKTFHKYNDWIYDLPIPFKIVEKHCSKIAKKPCWYELPMSNDMLNYSEKEWDESLQTFLWEATLGTRSISVYEIEIDKKNNFIELWYKEMEYICEKNRVDYEENFITYFK
jgi:hypothetical protein